MKAWGCLGVPVTDFAALQWRPSTLVAYLISWVGSSSMRGPSHPDAPELAVMIDQVVVQVQSQVAEIDLV